MKSILFFLLLLLSLNSHAGVVCWSSQGPQIQVIDKAEFDTPKKSHAVVTVFSDNSATIYMTKNGVQVYTLGMLGNGLLMISMDKDYIACE